MSRNKPLSKKEQQEEEEKEEEELREKVKKSGFYYENMSLEEIKLIEKTLNNKNDGKAASTSTSVNTDYMPKPSYSYRNEKSNNSKYSSEEQFGIGENSSEYDTMSKKNNLNNENSNSDSELSYKNTNSMKEDYPVLKNKSSIKNNKEQFQPRDNKRAWNRKLVQNKWRLGDPLSVEDDNDYIPLKQPDRIHNSNGESLPYLKSDDVDDETFEKLCQQMRAKLDTLHNQFTMVSGDKKWGSPIKATGKWIEPLDKTAPDEKPVLRNDHSPEVPFRDTRERATKRKAMSNIAAYVNDSSDENSECEFDNKKKRKCQQGKKGEDGRRNQESQRSTSRASTTDMIIDVSDSNDMYENLNTNAPENIQDNQESEYPRRIKPPNPSKRNFKGPRGRKKNTVQSQNSASQSQNSSWQKCINDEEIQKTLSELTEHINDSDCIDITTEINTEIKPAQVPKNISNKISEACSSLQKAQAEEREKIKAAEEAKQQKEKEELMKKDELISRRMQENEDALQRKIEKERKLRERDESYRNKLALKHSKVTRSSFLKKGETEEELLDVDDDDVISLNDDTTAATTACPICHENFPNEQIETHASECDAFSSVSDEMNIYQPSTSRSRNNDASYKCEICNNYRTCSGNDFADHVNICKEKAEDRRNEIYV